jgi:hypothetical protein
MSTDETSKEKTCDQTNLDENSTKQMLKEDNDIEDIFYGDQNDNVAFDQEIANKHFDNYGTKFYNEGFREALSFLEDEAGVDSSNAKVALILQMRFHILGRRMFVKYDHLLH